MRRLALLLIAALLIIFITLSIVGRNKDYDAEKLLFSAVKKYEKISRNPDVVPPQALASVESTLKKILTDFPETKAALRARVKLMELYFTDKKYDNAIAVAGEIIEKNSDNSMVASAALFMKANCYELKGEWNKSLPILARLKEKYLNTSLGLQVPFYIANYYKNKDDKPKAENAFNEAASFYKNLKEKFKGTPLGYVAANILIQTYMSLENYEAAGQVVKENISDYPATMTLAQQMAYVDLIFVKTLKRPQEAVDIYEGIKEKAENAKLKEFLQTKIDEIKTLLKSKKAGV